MASLEPGDPAYASALPDQHGNTVRLEDLRISPDRPEAQLAFDRKHDLGFPLLSDPDHQVAEAWGAWGAWGEKTRNGTTSVGIIRSSFPVDEDGRIERAWYGVKPEETVPNALAAIGA